MSVRQCCTPQNKVPVAPSAMASAPNASASASRERFRPVGRAEEVEVGNPTEGSTGCDLENGSRKAGADGILGGVTAGLRISTVRMHEWGFWPRIAQDWPLCWRHGVPAFCGPVCLEPLEQTVVFCSWPAFAAQRVVGRPKWDRLWGWGSGWGSGCESTGESISDPGAPALMFRLASRVNTLFCSAYRSHAPVLFGARSRCGTLLS